MFGVVLVFRDVSEARRKDNALRTFRAVVEASTDFIAFGRVGGTPDYVNPAGLRLVGLASQEAASARSLADYYTPEMASPMRPSRMRRQPKAIWSGQCSPCWAGAIT